MKPCEICDCACERGPGPGELKLGETVVCKSHGFSFHITGEGQCQLKSVRGTAPEVFQRAIGRIVRCGKNEHAAGGCLRITSEFVRTIMTGLDGRVAVE